MRSAVSVLYEGDWADRVAKMKDTQVAAIYYRNLDKIQRKMKESN